MVGIVTIAVTVERGRGRIAVVRQVVVTVCGRLTAVSIIISITIGISITIFLLLAMFFVLLSESLKL